MKVLLINGSPNKEGSTNEALKIVASSLNEEGIDCEIVWLGNSSINDCIACRKCSELNKCVFDDVVNEVAVKCYEADGFIFGSPVYFAHPSGRILSFLDRIFYSHRKAFSYKPAASITVARRAGTTSTFDVLNKYASISSMPIISSSYWNMAFGAKKEDIHQDLEGIDTLINIGKNMAWILKCIELGKENGIEHPINKARKTNFIR